MIKKTIDKQEELSKSDLERLDLLQKANVRKGQQLTINYETGNLEVFDELKHLLGEEYENPEQKYNSYYGTRSLLKKFLPKGDDNKQLRDIIYDELNVFLNLGKKKSDNNGIRKSDGRMTYQPVMNEIQEIILKWVENSQNPFDLYCLFYELNEKHGYGHEQYDDSTKSVAKAMLSLSNKSIF